MVLHTLKSGSGPAVFFLHGLFGDGKNLYSISRDLENRFSCYLADQRNHGKSAHDDKFSYSVMAEDLNETLEHYGISKAIVIGHSMGAKTSMEFALRFPEKVRALVCMDSSPGKYDMRYDDFVKSMRDMDLPNIGSREEAEKYLTESGINILEAKFLLKNLVRNSTGFSWRINLGALINNYENIWAPVSENLRYNGPVLFLKGEKSNFITEKDEKLILKLFPSARIAEIKNAGHWLHIDNTAMCNEEIGSFLASI